MKLVSRIVALGLLLANTAHAADTPASSAVRCVEAAGKAYHFPPAIMVVLLSVEGGTLGRVSRNTNGTFDIGPMQVNDIWIPQLAAHWGASQADTYAALRDRFCPNVEAGAWILSKSLEEAHGNLWEGVALYHSHRDVYKVDYLRKVLRQVLRLQPSSARPSSTETNQANPQ